MQPKSRQLRELIDKIRRKSSEPRWAQVLNKLYEGEHLLPESVRRAKEEKDDMELTEVFEIGYSDGFYSGVGDEIGASLEEVKDSVEFLRSVGLVEKDGDETNQLPVLTEKGFEIAHQRQIQKKTQKTNAAIATFTLGLVVVGLVEALSTELIASGNSDLFLALVGGGGGGLVLGLVIGSGQLSAVFDIIR